MSAPLRIGTRSSRLALWQAHHVQELLARQGQEAELVEISTQGDQDQSSSFSGMSGSGFFTKAIEEALLAEKVDIAVHSHKDLETTATPGTRIAAIPERAISTDLLLVHPSHYDPAPLLPVKKEGMLGSSSPRRQEQVRMYRPDLQIEELRGNVPTRLQKLRDEKYSAILIAKAGIERLEEDVSEFHSLTLPEERFIPAPAQGALAVQIREDDTDTERIVKELHYPASAIPCGIERGILQRFRGGCQLPLGAHCREEETQYRIWSMVLPEGSKSAKRLEMTFSKREEGIADRVAAKLKSEECRKVFISKDLPEDHWWVRTLEGNGHRVMARSLIEQEALPVKELPDTPTVFFSSRNGVRFFMEQMGKAARERCYAVYGPGTAENLAAYGIEPEFVGSGPPEQVARQLTEWLKREGRYELLIPGPEDAAREIPRSLSQKGGIRVHERAIYRSVSKKEVSPPEGYDTLIFTSPSNVAAFAEKDGRPAGADLLAIGPSTASSVKEHFPTAEPQQPFEPGLLGLMDLFFSSLSPKVE